MVLCQSSPSFNAHWERKSKKSKVYHSPLHSKQESREQSREVRGFCGEVSALCGGLASIPYSREQTVWIVVGTSLFAGVIKPNKYYWC
jgi:hypothetical protein